MMDYLSITDADINGLELDFDGEWSFDDNRRNALRNHDDVQACPGSGKTTLVSAKLILLAKKWKDAHTGICVLTHTNVAKDEIMARLQKHPAGHKLLSYPHFVGTIQEFANKFLAIPYCRSRAWPICFIDDEKCVETLERTLAYKTKAFLKHRPGTSLYDFKVRLEGDELMYDVPGFTEPSSSDSYSDLSQQKKALLENGFYFFSEMYAFAEKLIRENPDVKVSLRGRFPFVFIDEMQDTQKYQDDLLNRIFYRDDVVLQRFGDPDQAIFNGMNGEKPNESFNGNTELVAIENSHRFGNDIAAKIKGLSYMQLANLGSIRNPPEGKAPHTIFLYTDQTIGQVLPEFGRHVLAFLDEEQRKIVKAVGSVGRENPNGRTIKHYWNGYDKSKSPKSFRATKLIHIVKKCSEQKEGNVSDDYDLLLQGILDFLRKADKKVRDRDGRLVFYNKTVLLKELLATHQFESFRRLLTSWVMSSFPTRITWNQQMGEIKSLLGLNNTISRDAQDFIAYDPHPLAETALNEEQLVSNIYRCPNGLEIEVATIHAVKGETHDATLILETKYDRYFDVQFLLDFLIDENKKRPIENHDRPTLKTSLQASFLKRLYVAASRPRHLLCMAIDKEHVSPKQIGALGQKGWRVNEI